MNKENIIRMAHEAQFEGFGNGDWVCTTEEIERFAALVAAAEREACAKVCEDIGRAAFHDCDLRFAGGPIDCAAAIRARGQE